MSDVEVTSILKDLMLRINSSTPLLPKGLKRIRGAQLPDGDLLISGGSTGAGCNDKYLHYKNGSNQWKLVGTMKWARAGHSSVLIDGNLLTTGGYDSSEKYVSKHEEFSIKGRVKQREMKSIELYSHAATLFDKHTILISGGTDKEVNKTYP